MEEDEEVGLPAPEKVVKSSKPELKIRLGFVFWKTTVSMAVSFCALWAIIEGFPLADDTFRVCFELDGVGEAEEIETIGTLGSDLRKTFGLCNFQLVTFVLSMGLILPLLSESLLANMVFFNVIVKGNIVSKDAQRRMDYYIEFGVKYFPILANLDVHHREYEGMELLEDTLRKIANLTFWVRLRRHIFGLFGVLVLIPIIFIWRAAHRSVETVLCLPKIINDFAYRKQWREGWRNLIILPLILGNDPVSVLLLFPLSFVVIFSSTSFAETIVNLVAVQVFARLDE